MVDQNIKQYPDYVRRFATLLVVVLTAIFYLYTLSPSLAWGDGTKLQTEAITGESFILAEMTTTEFSPDPFIFAKVGVAAWDHPLYIIIGHTLVRMFPNVDSLWLVNLLSALFGVAAVALVFQLSYEYTHSLFASYFASFSLAVSHTFWWHSSTPEVYTLFFFLLLLSLYLFHHFERNGKFIALLGSACSFGLAASNHLLAFLAIPGMVLYYLLARDFQRPYHLESRYLVSSTLAFFAGFSPFLVQFARMIQNFPLNEVFAPMAGLVFLSQLRMLTPALLGKSLVTFLSFLTLQFNPFGLLLGANGIRWVLRSRDVHSRIAVAFFIIFAAFGLFYLVADQFAFFLGSYIFWAMIMAIGVNRVFSSLTGKIRILFGGFLALGIFGMPFFYNVLPDLARKAGINDASLGIPQVGTDVRDSLIYYLNPNKRGDFSAYRFGEQTMANLAPHSVVIAQFFTDTDEYFVFRYFANVEGLRPDVTLVGWPTQDPFTFDPQVVLDVIESTISYRPMYLASLSEQFYGASKLIERYCIVPEINLYRLYPDEFTVEDNGEIRCIRAIPE